MVSLTTASYLLPGFFATVSCDSKRNVCSSMQHRQFAQVECCTSVSSLYRKMSNQLPSLSLRPDGLNPNTRRTLKTCAFGSNEGEKSKDSGKQECKDGEETKSSANVSTLSENDGNGGLKESQGTDEPIAEAGIEDSLLAEKERSALLARELRETQEKVKRQQRALQRVVSGRGGALGSLREGLFGWKPEEPQEIEKLDLTVLRKCFSYTDFWPTSARSYGSGGLFVGNLRGPIQEVQPRLQEKLQEGAGVPLYAFFLIDDITGQQVCVVQPKAEVEARIASNKMTGIARWPLAAVTGVATIFAVGSLTGVNLDPLDSGILDHAVPLGLGLGIVLGIGEIFQRIMAQRYNVKLSPPYFLPTGGLGCLGVATKLESILPSNVALFDIAASRIVGSGVAALMLAIIAFLGDGGVNGGPNPLYVEASFFQPNLLLSFIQYVIGPYTDELGNVLPHAVEGVGVPVNPLAFAGLLGLVITAVNLIPGGQMEGGRLTQALFGRKRAKRVTFLSTMVLGIGGICGSVLCLTAGFVLLFFRNGQETPALEEIEPIGKGRQILGWFLFGAALLVLLPNSAGTFPSAFFTPAFYLS